MGKYFLDTEFIEDGATIDLISIGIVCEDGREYYAINYDCDRTKANDWVKENVLKFLPPEPLPQLYRTTEEYQASEGYKQGWRNREVIADEILTFVG
jgi:3' exoribonuclease, RNase T-like